MGEYDENVEPKDSKITEVEFFLKSEKFKKRREKEFVPFEETKAFKAGFVDTFEPKDEKDDNPYIFEAGFTPKDEPNAKRVSRDKIEKEKDKKIDQQPKKIKRKEVSGNIKGKTLQKLYNDGERKECGRCYEIKPINHFEFRRDHRREDGYYRSTCKDCTLETKQIYALTNKRKIIQNIYGGKLQEKCQQCNISIRWLPALDFHHPFPELKTKRIKFGHMNWEEVMKKLEIEKVNLECKNCHSKDQATSYYDNKILVQQFSKHIQERNLIPQKIEDEIEKFIKQQSTNISMSNPRRVKAWIRKFVVINMLYDGRCVACKQITTKNNLPGLQFHHRNLKNPNKKKWKKLLFHPIPEIIKTLKNENCVCVCANCQRMAHSHQFKKNHESIVDLKYWKWTKNYYKIAEKNIRDYYFK